MHVFGINNTELTFLANLLPHIQGSEEKDKLWIYYMCYDTFKSITRKYFSIK